MYWLGAKSAVKKAVPTLQGLALRDSTSNDGAESVTVFPWTRVGTGNNANQCRCWRVYDVNGDPVRKGRWCVRLRVAGNRAAAIARRAQRRAFKRAWKDRLLAVTDSPELGRGYGWVQIILGVIAIVWLGVMYGKGFVRLWTDGLTVSSDLDTLWLARAVSIAMFFCVGIPMLLSILLGLWTVSGRRVARMTADAWGIRAKRADGTEFAAEWLTLRDVRPLGWTRITLLDGRRLYAGIMPQRMQLALDVIRTDIRPDLVARDKRAQRRAYLRCALWWTIGCVAVGLVIHRYQSDRFSALGSVGIALVLLVLGLSMFFFAKLEENGTVTPAQRRHRRRRRQGAPGSGRV